MTGTYDIEVLPNCFTLVITCNGTKYHKFVVSNWHNDFAKMRRFLDNVTCMIGFNSMGYDYPIMHLLLQMDRESSAKDVVLTAVRKSRDIINTSFDNRFQHMVRSKDQIIPQVDLYRVHHYDNFARATSLKMLEFVMRKKNIMETPLPFDEVISKADIPMLLDYNVSDVEATYEFAQLSVEKLKLREQLTEQYGVDMMCFSDAKIGSTIMIKELEARMGSECCFYYEDGERKIRKTKRPSIALKDCILPYIKFDNPAFEALKDYLEGQVITETKGVFADLPYGPDLKVIEDYMHFDYYKAGPKKDKAKPSSLHVVVDDIKYVMGLGGLHGCAAPGVYETTEDRMLIDWDVRSFYPELAIQNRLYPEHLGTEFCDIYAEILQRRLSYKKSDPNYQALKLALNATYGNSNSQYSPFFDPKFTMMITIGGQFSLLMLVDMFMSADIDIKIVQANTDGVTVDIASSDEFEMMDVVYEWQKLTKLTLEREDYSKMVIRDVNNYIGVYKDGKVKRKGAYEHDLRNEFGWHKNHSALVVAKAAEAHMLTGADIREFLENHDDPYDFCLRTKITGQNKLLVFDEDGCDYETGQKITRYYVSTGGNFMLKKMPPTPKKLTKKLLSNFEKLGVTWDAQELEEIQNCLSSCTEYKTESELPNYIDAAELTIPYDRLNSVEAGWSVKVVNEIPDDWDPTDINYDYYEAEVTKLCNLS